MEPSNLEFKSNKDHLSNECRAVLGQLLKMEKSAKYSEEKPPELPEGGNQLEPRSNIHEAKFIFTGFRGIKYTGAEFCCGKYKTQRRNVSDSRGYKYLTQEAFDEMVEKLKEALALIEKIKLFTS